VSRRVEALVLGAGAAGLATSRELLRAGVPHVVLERGDQVGCTWANLYESLVLHTAKGLSALPGLPFPSSVPVFPTRRDVLDYLYRYTEVFKLPIETGTDVTALRRGAGTWVARTAAGVTIEARAVVVATGIVSNPHVPAIPHRHLYQGRLLHSIDYRRPDGFAGNRVLVVGAGNSAGEISVELARAGADVTLAVRTGASIVPREIAGIPIQYFSFALAALPRPAQRAAATVIARLSELVRGPAVLPPPRVSSCSNVPLIGFYLADAIRAGAIRVKGDFAELTRTGVRFRDDSEEPFDVVILATGYRAAVSLLGDAIRLDDCGFARRRERVVSVDQPDLYFVGHNYDIRGGLANIRRDATLAAKRIKSVLADRSRRSTETPQLPNER
jgi:hypothetical protein